MLEATAEIAQKTTVPDGNIRESDLLACVPRLPAHALSLTKSRDSADELRQETILRAPAAARQSRSA